MVIDDLYVDRPWRALGPFEAHPPLVIDAKAVVAFPLAPQGFETVAGQIQIDPRRCRVQLIELHFHLTFQPCEGLAPLSQGELPGSLVSKADEYGLI